VVQAAASKSGRTKPVPVIFDRSHLAQYTLDSPELEREIVGLFVAQLPAILDRLQNGASREDWRIAAHTLKGSALAIGAWRRRADERTANSDADATIHSRPHRTAVVKTSRELMEILGKLEVDLRRAAQEEGWNVHWEEHQQAVDTAVAAMEQGRFGRAVRDYARTIDLLMSDLPKRRAAASAVANSGSSGADR